MSKNQFTGTATQPQRNRKFCQFNKNQYCTLLADLPNQSELSERGQSAVTLKELPSHRSENMVTFTEQSYTAEGNQMWTFDVLKKLVVHVYTGEEMPTLYSTEHK